MSDEKVTTVMPTREFLIGLALASVVTHHMPAMPLELLRSHSRLLWAKPDCDRAMLRQVSDLITVSNNLALEGDPSEIPTCKITLRSKKYAKRPEFTSELAKGWIVGSLLTGYPLKQVSELRQQMSKLWPDAQSFCQTLYQSVEELISGQVLIVHGNRTSDTDQLCVEFASTAKKVWATT
jgi:hypothetical protein